MIWAGFIALIGLGCIIFFARKSGERDAISSNEEKINQSVRQALATRDRLHADTNFAKRVRERFKR